MTQSWYDDNRERFEAEMDSVPIEAPQGCNHYLERKTSTQVECKNCHAGWLDLGRWEIKDGKPL